MRDAVKQLLWGVAIFLAMIIMLAVGSKFDYQIAVAMYAPGNFFSLIMSALAKMPAFFLMGASCAILVKCAKNKECNIVLKRFFYIIYSVAGVISVSFGFLDMYKMIFTDKIAYQYILSIVCGLVLYVLFMLDLSKYRDLEFERYKKWAFTVCITVGIVASITYGLQFLFGRLSYDQVHNGVGEFVAWYKLQQAGGMSMPDNKTGLAFTIFLMLPLTKIHSKMYNKSFWFLLIGSIFVILVMLGGMFNGSYYFSSVALGGLIGYVGQKVAVNIAFGPDGTNYGLSERNILNKL